jgi:hypothetical protein
VDKILVEDGVTNLPVHPLTLMDSSRNGPCLIHHPDAAKFDGRVPTDDLISD